MAVVAEVPIIWEGFPGGPGVSTFFGDDVVAVRAALGAFVGAIDQWVPGQIELTIPDAGRNIDAADGSLVSFWQSGAPIHDSNTLQGSYSAVSGVCINWLTNGVVAGRLVRGRTFMVPLLTSAYELDGTIAGGALDDFRNAATVLALSGALVIWSRPFAGDPDHVPPIPARAGTVHAVGGSVVNDRAAVLRSRRD